VVDGCKVSHRGVRTAATAVLHACGRMLPLGRVLLA
jgi:hypothetical protein